MGGELFGVKGRKSKQIEIERKIRPFRHAYIKLSKPAGTLTWEYVNNINEFGSGLVTSVNDGTGSYQIGLNVGAFKNVNNVIQEVNIIHSTTSNIVITAAFTDSTKTLLNIGIFDVTTYTNVDVVGEILVVIREFYE